MKFFTAGSEHAGRTIAIIGGGPSLRGVDLLPLRGKAITIAVNNAYELAPWAEYHLFGDRRWWEWHGSKFPADFQGKIISTSRASFNDPRILKMDKTFGAFSKVPHSLYGVDSGTQAVNLAAHLGARRIVLLGFDMGFAPDGEAHWHADHKIPSVETNYIRKFLVQYEAVVLPALASRGVEIVRVTPSRLTMIPQLSMQEALREVLDTAEAV